MRFLVVSDLHGDLDSIHLAIDRFSPDALPCCGYWGDPEQVAVSDVVEIVSAVPILTRFGNRDPTEMLAQLRNDDGSSILLAQGEVRDFLELRVAVIGGIWAKSRRKSYYVSDDEVAKAAMKITE